jgi:hypothetical protein
MSLREPTIYSERPEKKGRASHPQCQVCPVARGEGVAQRRVPHVTLKSLANNEPSEEEALVNRPEKDDHITRVTGPFCVEAIIPTPVELGPEAAPASSRLEEGQQDAGTTYTDRGCWKCCASRPFCVWPATAP